MDFLDFVGFVGCAVGRYAVVKRAAAPGDVHFVLGNVVPHGVQLREKGFITRFRVHVCYARVQVVGADSVTHYLGLFQKWNAVLVVVGTFCGAFDGDQVLNERQVFFVVCGAVQLRKAHVMRRANGVARLLRSGCMIEGYEKIGCLFGNIQHGGFPRGTVMHTGRGHQMAKVISLETQPVGKHFAFALLLLLDDRLRVNIAVRPLRLGDHRDGFVHKFIQCRIFRGSVQACYGFECFVKIPVVKGRPFEITRFQARSDLEIAKGMAQVRVGVGFPELRHHGFAAYLETVGPKTLRPLNGRHVDPT